MNKRNPIGLVCVFVLGLLVGATANATLLGVDAISTNPDLTSNPLTVTYTASDGHLAMSGVTPFYTPPEGEPMYSVWSEDWMSYGTFTLSAIVDASGNLLAGGTLTVSGQVYDESNDNVLFPFGVLLQGSLTAFGYQVNDGVGKFDFLFDVTGGQLADLFGPQGGTTVDLNTAHTTFTGSFSSDFSNVESPIAVADTKMVSAIPEPEPQLLVILSVLSLYWAGRNRAPARKRS
jgi:hypothetical protein